MTLTLILPVLGLLVTAITVHDSGPIVEPPYDTPSSTVIDLVMPLGVEGAGVATVGVGSKIGDFPQTADYAPQISLLDLKGESELWWAAPGLVVVALLITVTVSLRGVRTARRRWLPVMTWWLSMCLWGATVPWLLSYFSRDPEFDHRSFRSGADVALTWGLLSAAAAVIALLAAFATGGLTTRAVRRLQVNPGRDLARESKP